MRRAVLSLAFVGLAGCSGNVRARLEEPFPKKLSAWKLFTGAAAELHPNFGVVPYDLNTTLFTDYATKRRHVWMPPGTAATYKGDDTFEFPKGTILVKTFSYPEGARERLIETRLLVNAKDGWVALPYVWNAAQTDATLDVNADPVDVQWNGEVIHYAIPNSNQCRECHDQSRTTGPIGPKARHLNRDFDYPEGRFNQLAYWTKIGYLRDAADPSRIAKQAVWNEPATGTLDERARAYLEVNCAHCHSPNGSASNTGLYLTDLQADAMRLGFCKTPVSAGKASAGLLFDAVRGHPELSILAHRMESNEPKVMMPEIGRTLVHREGAELIRQWLASMEGGCEASRPAM
ncbi:MAG TPA: SO2930 family diheme c-type cytochrome [Bryobacteraceae bacterium]|nr:SO2930 family diheme c-type cytochrome [Bryobacteraceae bacterium]